MSYSAEISRANPTCLLFLLDESMSMSDQLPDGRTKADEVALILNRTLQDLIIRCGREDGVRDYFDVGVIGYHNETTRNALPGPLNQEILHPLSQVDANPLRVEDRMRTMPDGIGGLIEVPVKFPTWYVAFNSGGTPMCAALTKAAEELATWSDAHPSSFPPVVLHLTDGDPTDGDPEPIAEALAEIGTDDGSVILMNIHISPVSNHAVIFPDDANVLSDDAASRLFRMSSFLPPSMAEEAKARGYQISTDSRAFVFNAKSEEIIQFFQIGTRPSTLR